MNSIIDGLLVGLLGGFFVYLVFLSIQVNRLQKENDNFRSQIFSIRWNFLDLKDKVEHKKQQNDDSVIHSNDPNNYYVGDVIKFWNDKGMAKYKRIAYVEGQGYLFVHENDNAGYTDSFYSNTDEMVQRFAGYFQHYKKVNFQCVEVKDKENS